MAPKTRSTTAQEKTKVSFTVDGNPFSLLSSQPPNPSCPSISTRAAAPPCTPESPSSSPSSSPPSSPSTSASPPPSPSLHDSAVTEFFTISSRINSYSNWPHQHLSQTALAAAGFYHVAAGGEKDLVECAFCDIRWSEWPDKDYTIERLMEKHEDNCSWPEIMTDLYNHLSLFLPANTALSRTPNKIYTPTTPEAPKKPLTRIPHPSPPPLPIQKHNGPSPPQCPQLSDPQPQIQRPLLSQPTISTPKPRTYASVLASLPPTQPKRPHKTPPGVVLTIQDLAIRFKNKPSPFKRPQPTAQYGLVTTATNSLSKFLLSALPAFTRFLSDIHGEQFNWCEHTSGNSGFDKGFPYFGVE